MVWEHIDIEQLTCWRRLTIDYSETPPLNFQRFDLVAYDHVSHLEFVDCILPFQIDDFDLCAFV